MTFFDHKNGFKSSLHKILKLYSKIINWPLRTSSSYDLSKVLVIC